MARIGEPEAGWPIWLFWLMVVLTSALPLGVALSPAVLWPNWGWLIPVGLFVWTRCGIAAWRAHVARHLHERAGLSICDFARSFERRAIDTWVIRAVWQSLDLGYPVRADDRLQDDLGMEDIDLDFYWEEVARRCGRSLEHPEQNLFFDEVETVRDVVLFLNAQPRLCTAA